MGDVREIPLTKGYVTLVSADDYEWLSVFKWHVHFKKTGGKPYAARRFVYPTGARPALMHAFILPDARLVDHIDRNTLNNARTNLRSATNSLNTANSALWRTNTSGRKGVIWDKARALYRAEITVDYKNIYLGRYEDLDDAAKAYDKAAREHFGAFARLNFPAEGEAAA